MGLMEDDVTNHAIDASLGGSVSVGVEEKGATVAVGLGLGFKIQRSITAIEESISLTYDEAKKVNNKSSGNKCWGLYNISENRNDKGYFETFVTVDAGYDMVKTKQKVYSTDAKAWMSKDYKNEVIKAEVVD